MEKQIAIYVGINWGVVLFYLVAMIANIGGVLFKKETLERRSFIFVWTGLALHSLAILYWWSICGHGPYMAPSEVLSSDAWCVVAVYLVFRRFYPLIRPTSIVVLPAAFLLIALSNIYNPGIRTLPPSFGTIWLVIHILLYKLSLATLVVALAFSIFYLRKARANHALWLDKLPELERIDLYAYRFAGFGFIFWGISVLAGSIWAYQSWGRFWGWDPVETWALICWLVFGTYLHLRRFFGVKGRTASWLFMLCFAVALIAGFITSHTGSSLHAEYFK